MVFCFRKRKSSRLTACLLRFLSQLQQSTDTSGDRVLGDWRVGETAQLLKGRVGMVESELAGGFKIVRNVVAEDFKGLADLIAGFRGGLGATAHVGVIEVRQTVRLASGLSVGTLSGPFAGGMRMSMRSMASGSRNVTRSELRSLRGLAVMPRRRAVETSASAAS